MIARSTELREEVVELTQAVRFERIEDANMEGWQTEVAQDEADNPTINTPPTRPSQTTLPVEMQRRERGGLGATRDSPVAVLDPPTHSLENIVPRPRPENLVAGFDATIAPLDIPPRPSNFQSAMVAFPSQPEPSNTDFSDAIPPQIQVLLNRRMPNRAPIPSNWTSLRYPTTRAVSDPTSAPTAVLSRNGLIRLPLPPIPSAPPVIYEDTYTDMIGSYPSHDPNAPYTPQDVNDLAREPPLFSRTTRNGLRLRREHDFLSTEDARLVRERQSRALAGLNTSAWDLEISRRIARYPTRWGWVGRFMRAWAEEVGMLSCLQV